MSDWALMRAVRDEIRTTYRLNEGECEVMPDGQPKPKAGRLFVAVHAGEFRNTGGESDTHLHLAIGYRVTVTVRTPHVPTDRAGVELIVREMMPGQFNPETGFADRANRFIANLHMSYQVMNAANVFIRKQEPTRDGFYKPARFVSREWLGRKGPEWWGADPHAPRPSSRPEGYAVELVFGRAMLLDRLSDLSAYEVPS